VTSPGFAAAWASVGFGAYILLYLNHERIWKDRPLPQAPHLVTRLFRHGEGRLFAIAVAVELWGLTQFTIGLLVYLGLADPSAILLIGFVSTVAVVATGIAIDVAHGRRN
jgi:hypothetical protein